MVWFRKQKSRLEPIEHKRVKVPEDLWVKCPTCREIIFKKEVSRNLNVCPKCQFHFRIDAPTRLNILFDGGDYHQVHDNLESCDPLKFKDSKRYKDRLKDSKEKLGVSDSVVNAVGTLDGIPVVQCVMEYRFMGGSMGSVVGEKVTRAVEMSLDKKMPLIIVSASGGARMQEGVLSLMQMAKISAALAKLNREGLPYISVLTDPTTGGVTASYAMLGDINMAEPGALIGFAGPRVIEQTIREKLPAGFQRSEFLLEHGMLDMIVHRAKMKKTIARCLDFML
ncbi:acetyl-CoA carboxylase, carboxyltransferase subunit beta [Acidobacteriota bacterium]